MRIRPFIAILGLLLCAIAARADKPLVIRDSEAIKYVGKEVEVRGRVVSVTTSPLGTTFINFGGEYPKSNVRWVYRGRIKNCVTQETYHDPWENHQHHRHN